MEKKFLLSVIIVFIFGIFSVNSQVLLDENFNYPTGDSLTAHGWTWINSYINTIVVASGNLSYSGYGNSNIGQFVRLHNTGQDAYRQHDSAYNASVYVSFLIRVDSAQATGDYFFALLPNNSTSFYTMRTFIKSSGAGFQMGISKSSEAATYATGVYNLGTTYLVVVKYTFNTGSTQDDQLSLFVISGSIPGSEPAPAAGPITGTQTDSPNISRIVLRQGTASNAPVLNIDGFRVFRSWSNIVGINHTGTVAEGFALSQNYPNPFNPSTNIKFSIPERGNIVLSVYDMLGKEITNLVSGNYALGTYEVNFDGSGLGSGVYFYRINYKSESGDEFSDSKKLMLIK